jgi:hypothetical protein
MIGSAGLAALAGLASLTATAELPLSARGAADTGPAGRVSFGLWNPLHWAVTDRIELHAHPLIFFVAPHLEAQVRHLEVGRWLLSGQYALALPSPAMRLLQGHLFPSWDRGGGELGWTLVPRVGLLASRTRGAAVLTLRADLAIGIPLVEGDARPLETLAPLDLLFDPVLAGYRARVGVLYDHPLGLRWRWRVLGDVYRHGVDEDHSGRWLDHLTFRVGAGLDFELTRRTRLVLGVYAWNDFQHEVDEAGNSVRSNLVLPVLDLIWSSQP